MEYLMMPDDERHELVDGEDVRVPRPSIAHQYATAPLRTMLDVFAIKMGLGTVLAALSKVALSNTDVTRPDITFVSREREGIITEEGVRGAPDLIVEVFSPSVEKRDKLTRRTVYARHGIKEYWQVDTDATTVTVLLLLDNAYEVAGIYEAGQTLTSPMFEGLNLSLDETGTYWSAKIVFREGRTGFTYDDYLHTPDDERYEVLEGVLDSI